MECMGAKGGQEMLLYPTAEKRFVSPAFSPRPDFYCPPHLFIYLFLHWWEEVLRSPLPCAGEPQSLVVLGLLGPENDS